MNSFTLSEITHYPYAPVLHQNKFGSAFLAGERALVVQFFRRKFVLCVAYWTTKVMVEFHKTPIFSRLLRTPYCFATGANHLTITLEQFFSAVDSEATFAVHRDFYPDIGGEQCRGEHAVDFTGYRHELCARTLSVERLAIFILFDRGFVQMTA